MTLTASILGASGYAGGELLRLLLAHPLFDVAALGAGEAAGREPAGVHPHLHGADLGVIEDLAVAAAAPADICFSALPPGILASVYPEVGAPVVIDLADDHRASPGWVYGLPEISREGLHGARRIANPGCYPTATLLALVPFAKLGLIEGPVVVDAMSGISGAGKKSDDAYSFASLAGSVAAYGQGRHRHVAEMERGLSGYAAGRLQVSFTPHLVPMARGLLATCRARWTGDVEPMEVLRDAYAKEGFVDVTETWPSTKAVVGTNRALVHARLDTDNGLLVASCAIDNLGKGAAGQAVQNANITLGLEETLGLGQIAAWP